MRQSVLTVLQHDAFVAFLGETAKTYVVTLRQSRPIVVPKARAQPELFPPASKTRGEQVLGMIRWLLLGLLPVGIGALVLSPIVVQRAAAIIRDPGGEARDRRLAWITMGLAVGLGLVGLFFTAVLLWNILR